MGWGRRPACQALPGQVIYVAHPLLVVREGLLEGPTVLLAPFADNRSRVDIIIKQFGSGKRLWRTPHRWLIYFFIKA